MMSLKITCPKRLSKEEWAALMGTNLYATMLRNRMLVSKPRYVEGASEAIAFAVRGWLEENCNSLYRVEASDDVTVYIEGDADTVNFRLFMEGRDVEKMVQGMKVMREAANSRYPALYDEDAARTDALTKLRRKYFGY